MTQVRTEDLLWWVIPEVLAGMPMPLIHPGRRSDHGGDLICRHDDLPALHAAGVRAFISLVDDPMDAPIYLSAGFDFLHLPVAVGGAPTVEQAEAAAGLINPPRAQGPAAGGYFDAGAGTARPLTASF